MVKNGQYRLSGLDEKIIALHARGMSFRDIQAQLQEMYGVEVSPTLISNVTDAVIDEVKQWQNRPLDVVVHPIVFLDCLVIKVRDNLQQLPIKRTTRIILKALRSNAFKIILGSDLSAKRCK
jgi:putative transposase